MQPSPERPCVIGKNIRIAIDLYVQPRFLTKIGQFDSSSPVRPNRATSRNFIQDPPPVDDHGNADVGRQTLGANCQAEAPYRRRPWVVGNADNGMPVRPS